MFVNTLVIRSDVTADLPFRKILRTIKNTSLEAFAHQDLPFEKLVEELQPERDLSRNPLFQVMFALQNAPEAELSLPGIETYPLRVGGSLAEFDLFLGLREEPKAGGIHGTWSYDTNLFDGETIERMQGHFHRLLEGIVADPTRPVSELEILPESERRQLLDWGTGPELVLEDGVCIHHLFEARVAEDPDRLALEAEDGRLTYGELEAKANRLARHLVEFGAGAETLVGLSLPRTTDMLVAVLGILKAGGAYLPLDPDLPADRLAFMLEDGEAPLVVTTKEHADGLGSYQGQIVCVDGEEGDAIAQRSSAPAGVDVDPGQLAYVIYTSGSTGRPKGVEVCHHNVVNYLSSISEWPGLTADDVILAVTTLSFDASIDEILAPLVKGGRIVMASWEAVRDGTRLRALADEAKINLIDCSPAPINALLDAGWEGCRETVSGPVGSRSPWTWREGWQPPAGRPGTPTVPPRRP